MNSRRFMQAAAVAFGLISLSAFAAQDFSGLGTTELTQLKPSEMGEEDRNAFRTEMQKRSASMNSAEKDELRNQMREQKGQGSGGGQEKQGRGGGMQGGGGVGRGH
jgi:hypothetical protein